MRPQLPMLVRELLPTPLSSDAKSTCNRTATRHTTPPTGVHDGLTLTDALRLRLLPTPLNRDGGGRTGGGLHAMKQIEAGRGPNLDELVDLLSTGASGNPPSIDTPPFSDAPLPGLSSKEPATSQESSPNG